MKSKKEIGKAEFESILRDKLKNDPVFYIDFIRGIIDEIHEEISDDTLFELLIPSWSYPWPPTLTSSPSISPDSVDMLFYPGVRTKLKGWQQALFDESLKDYQRDKARDNIKRVFERLTYRGSGPRRVLSSKQESEVIHNRNRLKNLCQDIIEESRDGTSDYKRDLIKERFDWVENLPPEQRDRLLNAASLTKRAEEMRAIVLGAKFNCHPRNIKEIIRRSEEGFREFKKWRKKHPNSKSISITIIDRGSGKNKRILPH